MSDASTGLSAALRYTGGDRRLLRELLAIVVEDAPGHMRAIRDAVAGSHPADLMRAAHTIKGTLHTLGAVAAAARAEQLELLGRDGRLPGSDALLRDLERDVEALVQSAVTWMNVLSEAGH